jgi:hypothetical protein
MYINKKNRTLPVEWRNIMLNLNNKTKREEFINSYKDWTDSNGRKLGIWKSVPELDLQFYRYDFANGAVLIVTEYKEYQMSYKKDSNKMEKECVSKHRLCLIMPNDTGNIYHRTYTPDSCSMGTVLDYMTKNKLCL